LNGPQRRKTGVVRGVKGVGRMGGVPGMINMRKEVRGDRREESELKGMKGSRMVNSMDIEGKAIVSPRRFRGIRDVRGEKKEFASKIAKGSIPVGVDGKGGEENFGGVEESNDDIPGSNTIHSASCNGFNLPILWKRSQGRL
jgi:hypothetical protein